MIHRLLLNTVSASAALLALANFTAAHELNLHEQVSETVFAPPAMQLAAAQTKPGQTTQAPRLWNNLGNLTYAVTTTNPEAQKFFDQGLRLAYAFNHAEAARAFRHAQTLDPDCAMCFWGEALVLGPNINAPMSADAVKPAMAALAKAKAATGANAKEKALIAALATRYSDAAGADRMKLDAAYGEAMAKLADEYPDDPEIRVLAAEALMDTQPWDYWEVGPDGAKKPKGHGEKIVGLLEGVLKTHPDHPGAIHFYIHAMENSDTPERAVSHADRLVRLMPGAGHLVHMPSHIYYRIGRYLDSLRDNKIAAAADETYLSEVKDSGIYSGGYYPHNVHFVLTSAQMAGDSQTALDTARKLSEITTDEASATIPWAQPIKAAPHYARAQFDSPDAILAAADPGDKFPYIKAAWHYARGVAHVAKGDTAAALAEVDAIDAIANKADLSFLISNYIPADTLLQIQRHVLLGRIAQQKGYINTAIDEFRHAVSLQDTLPYMEPPFWYYPVRQSLGAALLIAGRAKEATEVFQAGLKQSPNNGWIMFGLKEAQVKLGDEAAAKQIESALAKAWVGRPEHLVLSRL